jgi:hypothetical protein
VKRLIELTAADFERVPVWRYRGEYDETALVEATDRLELHEDESETYLARTQFALANGAQFAGFCSPTDDSGLDFMQPVILSAAGPIFFWFDEPPSREFLAVQWQRLGVGAAQIFPVHFRCVVPVDGKLVTGVITEDDLTGAA